MVDSSDHSTTEKLILLVKENHVIYDSNVPRDNQMLKNTWERIAAAMGYDTVTAEGWKNRWRNIKDYYARKKRQTGNRRIHENRKEWPFLKMLTFLDNHITNRRIKRRRFLKVDEEDDDSEAGCLMEMPDNERKRQGYHVKREAVEDSSVVDCLVDMSDNERSPVECDENNSDLISEENRLEDGQGRAKRSSRIEHSLNDDNDDVESFVNNTDFTQEYEESSLYEDPDGNDAFFRSCSCRMNRLPQQAQSLLRLQITQLFFNAENPDYPDLEITTLPQKQKSNGVDKIDTS